MTKEYLGFVIVCEPNEAWDGSFKSNHLTVRRPPDRRKGETADTFICSMWWPSKCRDGIKEGIKLVDKHVKAMTVSPGKD